MSTTSPQVAFVMADYGHDPTETAIPYQAFKKAGFGITFLTEHGKIPECDKKMLSGWTGHMLGATKTASNAYSDMITGPEWQQPKSWSDEGADLRNYQLVFLPGGHDKDIRQVLDSQHAQRLLADYWSTVRKPDKHVCAAICHGVQLLAHTMNAQGVSVLHDVTTTSLTSTMENSIYWATRFVLGDYYKTYGHGTPNVESVVRQVLDDPEKQWKGSANMTTPLVVEDERYNYLSGRFPGDAQALAERVIERVKELNS